MQKILEELIKYHSENHCLDFKKEQYPTEKHHKKHEILKDFVAFLNNPDDHDKFILIGIKEKSGIASEFFNINELNDEAYYQQYISENIEPKISFEYKTFDYNEYKLSYFRIFNNIDRPYLFKKDVQNAFSNTNKTEYKKGEGFIRIGTSTNRLSRIEFDEIYKKKYQNPDRKSDLILRGFSRRFLDFEENIKNLKYIDIEIENISNKSIEFDIEMKLKKTEGISFITASKLQEIAEQEKKTDFPFTRNFNPIINTSFLHIEVSQIHSDPIIKRIKLRNEKNAICLQQNSKETDIFSKEIIFLNSSEIKTINAEIIIRSDDFTQGVLKKNITINL